MPFALNSLPVTESKRWLPCATMGFNVQPDGAGEGEGDGEGDGVGDGLGAGEGDGEGVGVGAGEGDGDGDGVGAGEGVGEGAGEGDGLGEGLLPPPQPCRVAVENTAAAATNPQRRTLTIATRTLGGSWS